MRGRTTFRTILVAALALASGCASRGPAAAVPDDEAIVSDTAVYGWRLRSLDGTVRDFAWFRGQTVVLNVWATWCPPCVAELGSFAALRDSLRADPAGRNVAFVLVAPETGDRVAAFARQHALDLPFFVEIDGVPREFGVRALPTTLVIDPRGRIVLRHRGAAEWNTPHMRTLLRELAS
jgi:thiol-disulfide isomerase/thioredoxin